METLIQPFMPIDFMFRCILALIMGGIIGLEREYKNKPAGLKTHTLICIGATSLTYLSFYFSNDGDPGRIAAQIVSGIGFIGGGTIMHSKHFVQGLTTAATLWVVASMGMLIGAGFLLPAFTVTMIAFFLLIIARPFSRADNLRKQYFLTVEVKKNSALDKINNLIRTFELTIYQKSIVKDDGLFLELNYSTTPLNQHLFFRRLLHTKGVGEVIKL